MLPSEWTTSPRSRRKLVILISSALSVVAAAAVIAAVIFGAGGYHANPKNANLKSKSLHGLRLPTPSANIPPLGQNVLADQSGAPTPCPVATPQVSASRGTPTPAATGQSTLTPCGTGALPGPKCYTIIPGANPTQDDVRQALYTTAVQHTFSFSLMEAISWQESGWQQNVKACDGGIGLMQLMPDTSTWLNAYYNANDSPYDLQGNINQGFEMLSYLYNYYIPFCDQLEPTGQTCDWDTVWPGATDGATVRAIVISAYNEGIGTMANYGIINWNYVNSVTSLWQQFLAAEQG